MLKAATRLRGTHFSIREQFPREIEEKRKQLYPILKDARNKGQQARLVRDKLLINNRLYVPQPYERDRPLPPPHANATYHSSSTETAVPHLSPKPYTPWMYQTQPNPYFPSGSVDMRHIQVSPQCGSDIPGMNTYRSIINDMHMSHLQSRVPTSKQPRPPNPTVSRQPRPPLELNTGRMVTNSHYLSGPGQQLYKPYMPRTQQSHMVVNPSDTRQQQVRMMPTPVSPH